MVDASTHVTLGNGPTADGQPASQQYKISVLAASDPVAPNVLQISAVTGGGNPIKSLSVTTDGSVTTPALIIQNAVVGATDTRFTLANSMIVPTDREYVWTVGSITGGGIVSGALQLFSYGSVAPGNVECMLVSPTGICQINRGILEAARLGQHVGTGAAVNIVVASMTMVSTVSCRLVGTTNAGGFAAYNAAIPAPVIVVSVGGFTISAALDLIYEYEVLG